jgi:hypothetical protein
MLAAAQLSHVSYGVEQKNVQRSLSMHSEHCTLFRLLAAGNVVSHCKDMVIGGGILTSSAHRRYNYASHIQVSCSPRETTRCEGQATGADTGTIILNV